MNRKEGEVIERIWFWVKRRGPGIGLIVGGVVIFALGVYILFSPLSSGASAQTMGGIGIVIGTVAIFIGVMELI